MGNLRKPTTKSQPAHTAAPWVGYIAPIQSEGGFFVKAGDKFVAKVDFDDVPEKEAEANAGLIIAAPDMLEALKELVKYAPPNSIFKGIENAGEKARKAIAKAETPVD